LRRIASICHNVLKLNVSGDLTSGCRTSLTVSSRSATALLVCNSAAAQQRAQLLPETTTGETIQVKVDGVVDVHQQEADGLDNQIT